MKQLVDTARASLFPLLFAGLMWMGVGCGQGASPEVVEVKTQDTSTLDVPGQDQLPGDVLGDSTPADSHIPDQRPADQEPDGNPDAEADADAVTLPSVWGWISVIEWNDVCDQWYLKTQWNGGVRAYFAEEASFQRALPHTLGFAKAIATVGACTLYDTGLMSDECLGMCMCLDKGVECNETGPAGRWCEEDEVCVAADPPNPEFDQGHCEPLPNHFQVGTITIQGLEEAVSMEPDELERYLHVPQKPNDLFDNDDLIMATTQGGELPPLSFSARGVAPLELGNQVVSIRSDQPSVVAWTPADPDSRVQVYFAAGSHDPNPLGGAILCDVPDGDGQVEVDYSLFQKLWYLGCDGAWMIKCSRITRYTRDVQPAGDKEVELFVGSARNLMMVYE